MKNSTKEKKVNRRRGLVLVRNVILSIILLVTNLFTPNAFAASGRYEIAFVDLALEDAQVLAEGVRTNAEVFYIDSNSDGIWQIAKVLQEKEHIDAIHIFSHGSEGKILLGNAELSFETLQKYTKELQNISNTLKKGGDLLIYGCNVAKGEAGGRFINKLAEITNADIAASSNYTGAKQLGGDWDLEVKIGKVETHTLYIDNYNGLLQTAGIMSFSEVDPDLDYTKITITRVVGEKEFTVQGGNSVNGLVYDGGGVYANEIGGNSVKLTMSVETGYMFNISLFKALAKSRDVRVDLTYANSQTGNFVIPGLNGDNLTPVNLSSNPIENVTQVVLSSYDYAVFQDFNIHNIKIIPTLPAATTVTASSLTSTGATLNGEVNAQGDATTVIFQYGTSVAYGSTVTAVQSPLNASSATPASSSITGLMPGTTYHYRVQATNARGTTYGEDVSFTTPAEVPGAPTIGEVTAGNGQATISFTPPVFNGGAAIMGYTVTSNPGGITGTGASGPITVVGLSNGTAYTFTVTATNSAGTGSASAASGSVTPKASQTITFNNPGAQNFGSTPTLTASSSAGGGYPVTFTSDTPSVCTITSGGVLTFISVGTATITASQPGDGSYLPATDVTQQFTVNPVVPGAPTIGEVTAGNGQATISFTPPAFTGGAAIMGYTVTSNPGGITGTGASGPITVTGLSNGTAYTFIVTATNSAGTSMPSQPSNSIMPIHILTDTERVETDYASLAIGYAGTDTAASITQNITLLEVGSSGTTIVWSSDNPSVVTDRGEVVRPVGTHAQVILTATITKNGVNRTKIFTVTVIKQPSSNSGTSGGGGSSVATPTTTTDPISPAAIKQAEEAIGGLTTTQKQETAKNIEEYLPYTLPATQGLTIEQLQKLTNNQFTKEVLKTIVQKPELLKTLGIDVSALSAQIVLNLIENPEFKDVASSHWANNTIKKAAELGLVAGFPDGTFAPSAPLKAVDILVFLDRVLLLNNITTSTLPRSTVEKYIKDKDHWAFSNMASTASKLNEETLKTISELGEQPITRELLAQVLYELTKGKLEATREIIAFTDMEDSPYKEAIDYCVSVGLISGMSATTMSPQKALTRAELMTVLIRLNSLLSD